MKWIKSCFAILMIFNVLFLTVIYQPTQVNANVVTKPLTITAKKVAKDLAKDSAVAMAEHIAFEMAMNQFLNGPPPTEQGYEPVCLDGKTKKYEDCPADKRAQIKKDLTSSDRSKIANTVETVLEKKTNTSSKWTKFLDFFIPIFLISGLVATFDAMLDGDSESFIDEVAQQALIDSGLLKPLGNVQEESKEIYDFTPYISAVNVKRGYSDETMDNITLNAVLKPGVTIKYSFTDVNGVVDLSTKESLSLGISFVKSFGGSPFQAFSMLYATHFVVNNSSHNIGTTEVFRGMTYHDSMEAAWAEAGNYFVNNIYNPVAQGGNVNAVMNAFVSKANLATNLVFQVSTITETPPEVETNYGTQTGLNKTKNPDGTKTLPGVDSFTYTYNNTYVYPSTESTTGWKDKTTGEDITVVEDDVVVDGGPTDPDAPPKEDENENDFVCEREMKLPDFKPVGTSFTNAFPFSIPWDIKRFLDSAFSGIGSERPSVDLSGFFGSGVVLEIPAYFDSWVNIAKKFIVVLFDISIIYLFYRFMKGGND